MQKEDASQGSSTESVRKYLIGICLAVNVIILSVFLGFYLRTDALFQQQLITSGRAFFEEIVITRKWLAQHEGVFVKMEPGDTVNPYLESIEGLKTKIQDSEGLVYMLKNPALVTREISHLADREGVFKFHITSLDPLNPENAPDEFEQQSLLAFAKGAREKHTIETTPSGSVFRYMAPLITEPNCLRCHAHQGYVVGDVRGGISLSIAAQSIMSAMKINRIYLVSSVLGVMVIIVLIVYFVAGYFIRDLRRAEQTLVDMAATDHLTGLLNRREGFRRIEVECSRAERSGHFLCAMMLDIDYFKRINDTHGHLAGDAVLKGVAFTLKRIVRTSDLVCRFGGEEFLVVLSETGIEAVKDQAERIRHHIEEDVLQTESGETLSVTISVGVACRKADETCEHLIDRADQALYTAKQNGRNRIEVDGC